MHNAPDSASRSAPGATPRTELRAALAALLAAAAGGLLLLRWPALELGLFAHTAARIAGLLCGSPVLPVADGWQLPAAPTPVLVTSACSGADYFLIVAALLGWRLARGRCAPWRAAALALAAALPLAIAVNALRIAALAQVHRWVIPLWPDSYANFLHLLTGVAVFLPALIALHLLLEYNGRRSSPRV
jgi:exosortase/archaeosortase family protein